jgi:hypothetical protein
MFFSIISISGFPNCSGLSSFNITDSLNLKSSISLLSLAALTILTLRLSLSFLFDLLDLGLLFLFFGLVSGVTKNC